jgi:membrane fusion protein
MKPLFRPEVQAEQSNRLQGEVSITQLPALSWLAALLTVIVALSLLFLFSAEYKRKETVFGLLQPKQGVNRVTIDQNGVVAKVWVSEGQQVQTGQLLLQLAMPHYGQGDTERSQSLQQELQTMISSLTVQKQQQQERYQIQLTEAQARLTLLQQQSIELVGQLQTYTERVQLNDNLVKQVQQLAGSGYISQLELNRQKDILLSLKQQVQSVKGQQLLLQSQQREQQSLLEQLPLELKSQLAVLDQQLSELRNQQTRLRHEQTVIYRASADGVVSGLRYQPGQSVQAGVVAMTIVPATVELEAVVYVPTRAVAFIDVGQKARIRFDAFPYERFGVHQATVKAVSQAVLLPADVPEFPLKEPSYRVILQLEKQSVQAYQRELALRPDMTLNADVITGQRNLLHWLFEPVLSLKGQL